MAWDQATVIAVWRKGSIVAGDDPNIFRKDYLNNWIRYSDYGDRNSIYGWEIDHIIRVENGGTDNLTNLRPLQWRANAARQ